MLDEDEQKVLRAKAFAWRAIGCAVWLGIILAILVVALMLLPLYRDMLW